VAKDDVARILETPVQAQAGSATAQQAGERRFSCLDRFPSQVHAVQFQEIEGIEERVVLVPQALERSETVVVAADGLAVD
jgi:hypothetical protein